MRSPSKSAVAPCLWVGFGADPYTGPNVIATGRRLTGPWLNLIRACTRRAMCGKFHTVSGIGALAAGHAGRLNLVRGEGNNVVCDRDLRGVDNLKERLLKRVSVNEIFYTT